MSAKESWWYVRQATSKWTNKLAPKFLKSGINFSQLDPGCQNSKKNLVQPPPLDLVFAMGFSAWPSFLRELFHPYFEGFKANLNFVHVVFFGSNGGLSAISGYPQPSESCDEWSCTLHSSSCHSPSRKTSKTWHRISCVFLFPRSRSWVLSEVFLMRKFSPNSCFPRKLRFSLSKHVKK